MPFFHSAYRSGLSKIENEVLRALRRRGYAVAIFTPDYVGNPLNRKPLEDLMVRAGRTAIRNTGETNARNS